jgi:hypothetical protein
MAFAALEGMKAQGIPALFTEDTDFIGGASGNADIRIIPAGRPASDCREKQMGLLFRHAYDKDGTAAEGIAMGICGGDNKIHDFIILPHTKPVTFEKSMHYNWYNEAYEDQKTAVYIVHDLFFTDGTAGGRFCL